MQEHYPDEDEDDEEKLEGLLRELAEHQRLKDSLTNQRNQLSQLRDNLARDNQEQVSYILFGFYPPQSSLLSFTRRTISKKVTTTTPSLHQTAARCK